jgi:hypothetical protein
MMLRLAADYERMAERADDEECFGLTVRFPEAQQKR